MYIVFHNNHVFGNASLRKENINNDVFKNASLLTFFMKFFFARSDENCWWPFYHKFIKWLNNNKNVWLSFDLWVWVQWNHHFIVIFLLIWILNQDRNLFGKNWIDIFIFPRFKCVIVDIFTMLMLQSFGLCLKNASLTTPADALVVSWHIL